MKHRMMVWLTLFLAGAFAALVAVIFVLGVVDRQVPVVDVQTVFTSDFRITPGALVPIEVEAFYRRSCRTTINRTLYDSKGVAYAMTMLKLGPSTPGLQRSPSIIPIPQNFPLGEARYVRQPSYECNWVQALWPIRAPERVLQFNVVPEALP